MTPREMMDRLEDTIRLQQKAAAEAERAAIVAWLRAMTTGAITPDLTADLIEAGDHLKDRPS